VAGKGDTKALDPSRFGEFVDIICYNCGNPGHHKGNFKKPRICFICKKENHVVDGCLVRLQGNKIARYMGSASSGLGFYNIDVSHDEDKPRLDYTKCGKLYIETRDISKEELQLELALVSTRTGPGRSGKLKSGVIL
jgi:hypothetical protein